MKSSIERRYKKNFLNLPGWMKRQVALKNISGSIGSGNDDVIILDGKQLTWEEFDYIFPDKKLIPASIQLDGRRLQQ